MPQKRVTSRNLAGKEITVEFELDKDGNVVHVKDITGGGTIHLPDQGKLSAKCRVDFADAGIDFPKGAVMVTHTNPTCFWYWNGTRWVYICV